MSPTRARDANLNFMDPLGANSPDFETRPDYNPLRTDRKRSRDAQSGSTPGIIPAPVSPVQSRHDPQSTQRAARGNSSSSAQVQRPAKGGREKRSNFLYDQKTKRYKESIPPIEMQQLGQQNSADNAARQELASYLEDIGCRTSSIEARFGRSSGNDLSTTNTDKNSEDGGYTPEALSGFDSNIPFREHVAVEKEGRFQQFYNQLVEKQGQKTNQPIEMQQFGNDLDGNNNSQPDQLEPQGTEDTQRNVPPQRSSRGQLQSQALLDALIQNQGQGSLQTRHHFGPQEREKLKMEQNEQKQTENSEMHVLLPLISLMCEELHDDLNTPTILANLRDRIDRLQVEPKIVVAKKKITKFDQSFRTYLEPSFFHKLDASGESFVKTFIFQPAPLGTFPTFQSRGQFPDQSVQFNPVVTSYEKIFGPHDVCLEIEIPLPELKKSYLSLLFPPTHVVRSHCCFLMASTKAEPSKKLYVLPPGHYRRFTFNLENAEQEFETATSSFTVPNANERWNVFEARNGLYFYRGRIFYLPYGYFITIEPPKFIRGLQILSNYISQGSIRRIVIPDGAYLKQVRPRYESLYAKYHEKRELMAVAKFHTERLNILISNFMKYAILSIKPTLDDRFGGFGDDVVGVVEQMEIAAYVLQLRYYLGYYGPAPPYSILKHEKVGPKNLNRRRLKLGVKYSRPRGMPIGDDGFPLPREPFWRPQSKLAREELPEEQDEETDNDLFHMEVY